jgi:serine/threonine protein kinase
MASALASLHGQGIVHMDVKPDNIMVGDDGEFKLGDFGLAARLDGRGGSLMEGDSRCAAGCLRHGKGAFGIEPHVMLCCT